jgi:hypothetical protein
LNGRINVRQPQLRFFPSFGENLELAIAVEDPDPDVTGERTNKDGSSADALQLQIAAKYVF